MNRSIATSLALLFAGLTLFFAAPARGQILSEDFENGGNLPAGWTNQATFTGEAWQFGLDSDIASDNDSHGAQQDHTTGSGYLAFVDDGFPDFGQPGLVTPAVNLVGADSTGLQFWYQNAGPDTDPNEPISALAVDVSVDGGSTFETINLNRLVITEQVDDWTQYTVSLTPYQGQSNVAVRFRSIENGNNVNNSDPSLDDVTIAEGLVDDNPPTFVDTHVFEVGSTSDAADDTPLDGQCLTADSTCTLRAAIEQANANANRNGGPAGEIADSIRFSSIPTPNGLARLTPSQPYLAVTDAVVIDGYTAPGYDDSDPNALVDPVVVIDGSNLPDDLDGQVGGLTVADGGSDTVIRGMVVNNVPNDGIIQALGNATNLTLQGNYIGVSADGTTPQPNTRIGVRLNNSNNLVGPRVSANSTDGRGNIIAASGGENLGGVGLQFNSDDNEAYGNYIGTNPEGDDLGNDGIGVVLSAVGLLTADDNTIGAETAPNHIAYNGGAGVAMTGGVSFASPPSQGNTIRFNRIFENAGIGIDIGDPDVDGGDGVTPNDPGDGDGMDLNNKAQNFPEIDGTNVMGDSATVTYEVSSAPANSTYPLQVDFYLADSDTSGEGMAHLATDLYDQSEAQTQVSITILVPPGTSPGAPIVATATDAEGNTSEFTSPSEPLPVELASFSGRSDGPDAAVLSWRTLSEKANAGFRIERKSAKTEEWTDVAFVESKAEGGTSQEPLSYQFRASGLAVGTHTFRLRQVDIGGDDQIVGDPIDVELSMEATYALEPAAPNPFREETTLSFTVQQQQPVTVALYNVLGQRVRVLYDDAAPAGQTQTLRLRAGSLASGTYFVRVIGEDFTATEPVVLVR